MAADSEQQRVDDPLVYVRLRKGDVKRTAEMAPGVFVDMDIDGNWLGIECVNALHCTVQSVDGEPPAHHVRGNKKTPKYVCPYCPSFDAGEVTILGWTWRCKKCGMIGEINPHVNVPKGDWI